MEIPGHIWALIEVLLPTLRPLVDATEALSAEEYPSVSCTMPMLCFLIQNDLKEEENDSAVIKKLKRDIVLGLVKRFSMPGDENFHTTVPAIAGFLDPRHKTCKVYQQPRSTIPAERICAAYDEISVDCRATRGKKC